MRVSRNPGVYFANRLCPSFVERSTLLAEVNARCNSSIAVAEMSCILLDLLSLYQTMWNEHE